MDTGACWATAHGIAKNWTRLCEFHFQWNYTLLSQSTLVQETASAGFPWASLPEWGLGGSNPSFTIPFDLVVVTGKVNPSWRSRSLGQCVNRGPY